MDALFRSLRCCQRFAALMFLCWRLNASGTDISFLEPGLGLNGVNHGVVVDDERNRLRQYVSYLPFLLRPGDGDMRVVILDEGKTLLLSGHRVMRLTRSGLPDLAFGAGVGQVLAPPMGDWGGRLPTPRLMSDGRLLFIPDSARQEYGSRIRRWTVDGAADPTFGRGSGEVDIAETINQVVQVTPDGEILLVTGSGDEAFLRRLLPDGETDPDFYTAELTDMRREYFDSITVGPDGYHWMVVADRGSGRRQLRRLLPNGRADLGFSPRIGVVRSFGFDALGRGYFQLEPAGSSDFGDPAQGGLVRFLADGAYDSAYRPAPAGTRVPSCEISPDGSTLVVFSDAVAELDPTGSLRKRHSVMAHPGEIVSARRQPEGWIEITIVTRDGGWPGWRYDWFRLAGDGHLTPRDSQSDGDPGWGSRLLARDQFTEWRLTSTEFAGPHDIVASTEARLTRTVATNGDPQVAFSKTGIVGVSPRVRVPLQRSGSTGQPGAVRGKIIPWVSGRWSEVAAISFEGTFAAGNGETALELSLPHLEGEAAVSGYLLRLESATGMDLSSWTECRLWMLDDTVLPLAGELRLVSPAGPDLRETKWLLGHWPPGSAATLETSLSLDSGPQWSDLILSDHFELGSVKLLPIATDDRNAALFRWRY